MALHPVFLDTQVRVRYSLPWDRAQTLPGGATYEAAQESARFAFHSVRQDIINSHTRSGALAASMRTDMDKRGSKVVRGLVRSNAEHARWFFGGTNGPIVSDKGQRLFLRDFDGGRGPVVRWVRGQEPKRYLLEEAAVEGLARVARGSSVPRGVQVRF